MRRLIIGCDGTWNSADQQIDGAPCPSNVVRLMYRVAKTDDQIPQLSYYDQGVGTGNLVDRYSGGAFGGGLEDNVHDAYRFLVSNYQPGDEIYLFGFSRGAFTARSVAGMIRKCGILRRTSCAQYNKALELYRSSARPDEPKPSEFRSVHSVTGDAPIPIKFVGVWDTVGALGIPLRGLRSLTRRRYQFHDTELSGQVQYACHALALDEQRGPFEPTLWLDKKKAQQVVKQTWFCGVHTDVGGGCKRSGLSDIALEWMITNAKTAGLEFEPDDRPPYPFNPCPTERIEDSRRGVYRLLPGAKRVVGLRARESHAGRDTPGDLDQTQSLHPSVLERWDQDPGYRPRNLRDYFKLVNDPRAGQ